jgi:lysophospholipase L1-like esterase
MSKVLWPFRFGAALLISLLIWEALLRVLIVSPTPYADNLPFGWMPRSHARGMSAIEGRAVATYNARGFRTDEIAPKAKGETRILCLGDSYTEGIQVAAQSTFASRLQTLLRENGVNGARVYNGGRSGPSVAYSVALSEEYQKLFAPDWVVILVRDQWTLMFSHSQEVRYRPVGKAFEIERSNYWDSLGRVTKIATKSGLRDLAISTYGKRQSDEMRAPDNSSNKDDSGAKAHKIPNIIAPQITLGAPADLNLARSLRAVEWTLTQLKRKYPRLIVVSMPESSPEVAGLLPVTPTEKRFGEVCAALQIPLVEMRPLIEADFARTHLPPFGFSNTLPWLGHPNEHGHELIARGIEARLRPLLRP